MEAIKVCEINDCICPHPLKCYAACASLKPKPSSPVRTVTRKEIVPGGYGPFDHLLVGERGANWLRFEVKSAIYGVACIREFARLLNEIADAMEDGK